MARPFRIGATGGPGLLLQAGPITPTRRRDVPSFNVPLEGLGRRRLATSRDSKSDRTCQHSRSYFGPAIKRWIPQRSINVRGHSKTRAGALQRSGPKRPYRPWSFRVDTGPRTGLSAPRASSCGPILGASAGSSRSGSKLQSALHSVLRQTVIARVRGSRGLYRTQEPHHFLPLAVRRHRHRTIVGAVLGVRGALLGGRMRFLCSEGGRPVASVGACPPRRLENSVLSTEAH